MKTIKLAIVSILCTTFLACGQKDTDEQTTYADLDLPKMSCVDVGDEIHCQGIDPNDPNDVPNGCSLYATGMREFLNGQLTTSLAYDCGYRNKGLRCFYFQHPPTSDDLIEDVVCQPDYS